MDHYSCSVVNCKNNTRNNSKCKFYRFPLADWKKEQRCKWIAFVNRKNVDGSPWQPKRYDKICSAHFIGGQKSDIEADPNYVPTIYPRLSRKQKTNESVALAHRIYKSLIKRRTTKAADKKTKNELNPTQSHWVDQGCQTISSPIYLRETTFICNSFIYTDHCDAQIQVDIATPRIVTENESRKKVYKRKGVTLITKNRFQDLLKQKHFQDPSIEYQFTVTKSSEHAGITTIKTEQECEEYGQDKSL